MYIYQYNIYNSIIFFTNDKSSKMKLIPSVVLPFFTSMF